MSCKIVACANMKGGVGKTTVAISLAEGTRHLSKGIRVLVIDLDLQMNASTTLVADMNGAEPWFFGKTIEDYLRSCHRRQPLQPMSLVHHIYDRVHDQLDLLPGKLSLVNFERWLLSQGGAGGSVRNDLSAWLGNLLREMSSYYQLIIIDTPPGLSLLAECAIQRSDLVVIPTVPNRLSHHGIETYGQYLSKELGLKDVGRKSAVLINMQPTTLTRKSKEWIDVIDKDAGQPDFPYRVFETRYTLIDAFRTAMELDRPEQFDGLWKTAAPQVLAATRELWSLLGAPLHERG